jgi:hypothetical protein
MTSGHILSMAPCRTGSAAALLDWQTGSARIDHLQAQLDKLRRMNFGSRSEKVSRRIAQMEAV